MSTLIEFVSSSTLSVAPFIHRTFQLTRQRQPFMFTFLFSLRTSTLSLASHYRSLHHQLGPLQRPLLLSTSPRNVHTRLWDAVSPHTVTPTPNTQPIYDLVFDPSSLTIHTTIPPIPDPGTAAAEGFPATSGRARGPPSSPAPIPWTRLEALNVHSQILNSYAATRRRLDERERTCKTTRGWWVVWMRLPPADVPASPEATPNTSAVVRGADRRRAPREAVLVRKASDYEAPTIRTSFFGRAPMAESAWGAGRLAEGIGFDTRRYIEGLLSLNR